MDAGEQAQLHQAHALLAGGVQDYGGRSCGYPRLIAACFGCAVILHDVDRRRKIHAVARRHLDRVFAAIRDDCAERSVLRPEDIESALG